MRSIRALMPYALFVALVVLTVSAQAGVPIQISHQGLLTDAGGVPVTGSHTLTFSILENPTGGVPLWSEVHAGVSITKGLFTVALGSVTPLSSDILAPAGSGGTLTTLERYLEIQVDGDSPLAPRTRLIAAPYAVAAGRVAGDIETGLGELTLKSVSGSHVDHQKASDAEAGRSTSINGVEVYTEQSDDDSSWATLSSQRLGRPAINTARLVSGGLGAVVNVTSDDDGDGTAERGLIAGTTSIAGTPSARFRGWNFGIEKKSRFQLSASDSNSSFDLDVKPNPQASRDNHLQGACDVITALIRCSTDNDGDGVPENTVTQSSADSTAGVTVVSRFASGPRQTTSLDGTFSHSSTRCETDIDGDGVSENSVAQTSDAAGSRLAIKTKGTGAQRQTATLDAVSDSGVVFDLTSEHNPNGRGGGQHHYVNLRQSGSSLTFDNDDDGTADHTVTETTDDSVSSVVLTSAFHSGPRQTVSQDGTFSHASSRCATDTDNNGVDDLSAESYCDASQALLRVRAGALGVGPAGAFRATPSGSELNLEDGGITTFRATSDGNVFGNGNLGIGTAPGSHRIDVVGGAYCDGTNWVNASDVNSKENFAPVDGREILDKLDRLNITRWNYKGQNKADHIGPTAQEFHAAFGVGTDDKSISTIDPSGIALAAIKALNLKLNEQLTEQAAENQNLRALISELREMIRAQAGKQK